MSRTHTGINRLTSPAHLSGFIMFGPGLVTESEAQTPAPWPELVAAPLQVGDTWAGWDPRDADVAISQKHGLMLFHRPLLL